MGQFEVAAYKKILTGINLINLPPSVSFILNVDSHHNNIIMG